MTTYNHIGSLITETNDEGAEQCLGFLFAFQGAVFTPDGKVEIPQEHVDTHNRLLSEALIKGLDENCAVGQGGTFYFIKGKVQTWTGTVVTEDVRVNGRSITFSRAGKSYRGRLKKDAECFNFRRVS